MGWWLVGLFAACTAIYATALSYPFVFDDKATIVDNASLRDLASARVLYPDREVPTAGRPLVNLSHALTYAVAGLDVRAYRAGNLAIHLLCALLLFALVTRTLMVAGVPDGVGTHAREIAFATTAIWTMHPLNTEVVEYITQRSESMMALCYLATLYAAARGIDERQTGAWSAGAVAACALGMLCKESMVTAPLALWLYDRTFVFASWTGAVRARWRLYTGVAATWIVLALVTRSGPRMYSAGFSTAIDPWTYLLNQAVMVTRYLRLAIVPYPLVVAYGPPSPLTLGSVVPPAAFLLALLAATCVLLVRRPVAGFVPAWVFLTLAPTSSVVPIATEVGAERRMYLPLMAIAGAAVTAVALAAQGDKHRRRVVWRTSVIAAAALAAITGLRLRDYASSLGLAETVLHAWPTPFAHAAVGTQLAIAGRHDEAIAQLRMAVPGYPLAYYHLGGELFNAGNYEEAAARLNEFLRLEAWRAEAVPARTMIARAAMLQKQWSDAERELRTVMSMTGERSEAHTTALGFLADTLFAEQRFADAAVAYQSFLARRPRDAGAAINLGVALAQSGRMGDAVRAFERAVEIDPANATARRNLAVAQEEINASAGGNRPAGAAAHPLPVRPD